MTRRGISPEALAAIYAQIGPRPSTPRRLDKWLDEYQQLYQKAWRDTPEKRDRVNGRRKWRDAVARWREAGTFESHLGYE